MKLFRTTCSHDHKDRPNHTLKLIAEGDKDDLIKIMNNDISVWMANDIVVDERIIYEEEHDGDTSGKDWDARRAELELMAAHDLTSLWMTSWWPGRMQPSEARWEMLLNGKDHREFVERYGDGSVCSTVYHFVD